MTIKKIMFIHKLYEHQKIYIFSAMQLFFLPSTSIFFAPFYALIYLQNSQTFLLLLNSYALNVFYTYSIFFITDTQERWAVNEKIFIGNALCTYWYEFFFFILKCTSFIILSDAIEKCRRKRDLQLYFSILTLFFFFLIFETFQIEFNSIFNWLIPSWMKQNSIILTEFNICENIWLHSFILFNK